MVFWVVTLLAAPWALRVRTRGPVPWLGGVIAYVVLLVGGIAAFRAWEQGLHHPLQALLGLVAVGFVAVGHVRGLLSYGRARLGIIEFRESRW